MGIEDKLLVVVAPCIPPYHARGIPDLDLSPEGIANEVARAYDAGANAAHLHVWDESGQPTMGLAAFVRTIELIRARCDIVIEGSTGGMNELTPAQRSVALQADIEMASLNPGSINYDQGVYVNSPDDIAYWAAEMKRRNIKPDLAIFDVAMIETSVALAREGVIAAPYLYSFVLGQKGALPATARNMLFLSETIPDRSVWGVAGHGGSDLQMAVLAMNMGGHVRAGFEDNVYYRAGELATSNAQLIERLVRIAREVGREAATPDEARCMLGLVQ